MIYYSALFGVLWVVSVMFFIIAMKMGPTGSVMLFYSFRLVIPIITDLAVLGTRMNVFQIIGLILLFISFYIWNRGAIGEKREISLRFIMVCIFGLFFNGLLMATVKLHQGTMPGVDAEAFVLYGFMIMVLISVICFAAIHLTQSRKERLSYSHMFKSRRYYFTVAGGGVTTAVANIIMLLAASQVPAAIQFPLGNGGSSIIAAIISYYVFKEKFTKKTALVFAVGIAALAIINIS